MNNFLIRNNLKVALRAFSKRKLHVTINLVGLSIAIAFCLLTFLFVNDEFSYDKFHKNGDRIHALYRTDYKTDYTVAKPGFWDVESKPGITKTLSQNLPFLDLIDERVPEIEHVIRSQYNGTIIRKDGKDIQEAVRYVDEPFFRAFSFDFSYGDASVALSELNNAVITEEIAEKYFGTKDVLGETLKLGGEKEFIISGVVKTPKNSSLSLNIVLRIENSNYFENHQENWGYSAVVGFLYLEEGTDKAIVEDKINQVYNDRFADRIKGQREALELSESNPVVEHNLINIGDIYLDPTIRFGGGSAPLYSYMMMAVALIVLLIASVNFVSISISSARSRLLEVTVRKVVGASKRQLRNQFYVESFLLSTMALVFGYTLMQLLLPTFNDLAGKSIETTSSLNGLTALFGVVLTIVFGWIIGGYPSRIMSRFNLINGLKGRGTHKIKPAVINAMVVFQFSLCILFISIGLTMKRQFNFIADKDLGFNKDQLVYVSNAWGMTDKLKVALADEPSVRGAFGAGSFLAAGQSRSTIVSQNVEYQTARVFVDHDFFKTLEIEFVEGRDFDPNLSTEKENTYIINQRLHSIIAADSNFQYMADRTVGIVKDFHFEPLSEEIKPMQFALGDMRYMSVLYVKLEANQIEQGIAAIEKAWDEVSPNQVLEWNFVDDYLANNYKDKKKWGKIVNVSSMTAIVIACIGLFGLTAINAMNRTKEIGIRKVLGANLGSLLLLLNKQVIWLVLISMLVAIPISNYVVVNWLDSFAYHIPVGYDLFVLAGAMCLLVVFLTVIYHSVKSSQLDPAELLRDE